ncbi:MAG: hypothetical protein KQI81_07990 [Deltaproteobacteria bacterium]|nr:hypothetical protein [Deltaproteobacteria bacterium]
MNEAKFEDRNGAPLQSNNFEDLLGKKSVKATFRLRPEVISVLSILSTQLGIKQKSLFDYLMEDVNALHAITRASGPGRFDKAKRVRKTLMLSQKSLAALKAAAEQSSTSLDDIVERLIHRLLPVFEKERRRQGKRENALAKIKKHFNQGKPLMHEIRRLVGKEDSLYQSFQAVMRSYAKAFADIETLVNKGKRIANFPIESLQQDDW